MCPPLPGPVGSVPAVVDVIGPVDDSVVWVVCSPPPGLVGSVATEVDVIRVVDDSLVSAVELGP